MQGRSIIKFVSGELLIEKLNGDAVILSLITSQSGSSQKIFIPYELSSLKATFSFLSRNLQGCTGSRQFRSIKNDLILTTDSIGDTEVLLQIEIRNFVSPDHSWSLSLQTKITVDQLEDIARCIVDLQL